MKTLFLLLFISASSFLSAQQQKGASVNVLFLGNSYVYFNDLPKLCVDAAASLGDNLSVESYSPGGYTFRQMAGDTAAERKIKKGGWNYVVLQEQSQLPSFPIGDVRWNVFRFATKLDSMVHVYSRSARTVFYMTWGRKNGDTQRCRAWPPVCTYQGMDSLLTERYTMMAQDNHALLAPVAVVWKSLRKNHAAIELYNADGSHPSPAGSYAAACTFVTIILKKDPTRIKFNSTLPAADAEAIRNIVKNVVYKDLVRWDKGR